MARSAEHQDYCGEYRGKVEAARPANFAYYQSRFEQYKGRLDAALFGEELVRALGKSGGDVLVRKALNNELADWLKLRGLEGEAGRMDERGGVPERPESHLLP